MNQPVVLTTRTLLVFLLAVSILSAGVAIAAARLSEPAEATAAASNADVVRELKKITKTIGTSPFSSNSLRQQIHELEDTLSHSCLQLVELNQSFLRTACN